jgi:hypothetical protein
MESELGVYLWRASREGEISGPLPSCESEITSLTSLRPRFTRFLKNRPEDVVLRRSDVAAEHVALAV